MFGVVNHLLPSSFAQAYLLVYGTLALTHILFQYGAATSYTARHRRWLNVALLAEREGTRARRPDAAIAGLVPVFQEALEPLRVGLEAIAHQLYSGPLVTVIVDDGSYLKDIAKYEKLLHPDPSEVSTPTRRRRFFLFGVRRRTASRMSEQEIRAKLAGLKEKRAKLLEMCESIVRKYPDRFVFIAAPANRGKRFAHKAGHDWVLANFNQHVHRYFAGWVARKGLRRSKITPFAYLTIDSDTAPDPLATENLVRVLIGKRAGAVTGYVDIGNCGVNTLTRMVDWRYWTAFHVERAAQSRFKSVMCCSGPLSLYRAELMDDPKLRLMELYITQTFLGLLCTFGDDRNMTNLILRAGYSVLFVPEATCLTAAPETMAEYKKQQTRWNMSFYREMLWSLKALRMHSLYMTYDLAMQFFLPFMLVGSLVITLWLIVVAHVWLMAVWYALTVVGIGLLRSVYGAWVRQSPSGRKHDWGYLFFSLYGFMYLWLLSVRFRALVKLFVQRDTSWQTRTQ